MGRDKAGLPWGDTTLLEHAAAVMLDAVDVVVVAAGPFQELPSLRPGVAVVRDREQGLGPLQGLASGLRAVDCETPVVVVGVDQPFLDAAAIRALAHALGDAEAAAPVVDGVLRPLPACYRATLGARAEALLASGERRLRALLDGSRVVALPVERVGGTAALADLDTAGAYERRRPRT
jgi:molybdopterin-guanine dinucleotide biosynthesis protein A